MTASFIIGDTRDVLATMRDGSVDLVLTSPPFLALRSYLADDHPDKHREIGSETDPATFVDTLLALTADWRRVLAPHGSIAVELGDTYSGGGESGWQRDKGEYRSENRSAASLEGRLQQKRTLTNWPLPKCLAMIPELYRVGLAYGRNPITGAPSPAGRWRVRNVVRWVRPNPPVGALGDKFRPATSELVIACTATDRWFDLDAVRTEHGVPPEQRKSWQVQVTGARGDDGDRYRNLGNPAGAPPLDWWKISTKGYSGSHYATFPPELCRRPIEAMCPRRVCRTCGQPSRRATVTTNAVGYAVQRTSHRRRSPDGAGDGRVGVADINHVAPDVSDRTTVGWSTCGCVGTDGIRMDGYHDGTGWRAGIVLDPFGGTGTTGVVATGHSRDAILIDLDPRNIELARQRLGMFLDDHTPEDVA